MWKYFLSDKNKGILNTSFSNPVTNLKMWDFLEVNLFAEKTSHLMLKAIFKYKYPSFIAINIVNNGLMFQFLCVSVGDPFKEII